MPQRTALERASKKQRANPIGEKLDKIEEMLRAWLAADSDEVGDEARAASLAALHARIEAEGLLDAIKAHEKETNAALSKLNKAAEESHRLGGDSKLYRKSASSLNRWLWLRQFAPVGFVGIVVLGFLYFFYFR